MVPIISIDKYTIMVFCLCLALQRFGVFYNVMVLMAESIASQVFWFLLVVLFILSEFGILSSMQYI